MMLLPIDARAFRKPIRSPQVAITQRIRHVISARSPITAVLRRRYTSSTDVPIRVIFAAIVVVLSAAVEPAFARDALMFSATENIRSTLVSRIRAERVRLDIAVWYLTDRAVTQAIVDRHRAGVPVRVIGDRVSIFENDGNTKREFEYLASHGVHIRVRYHPTWFPQVMHWKAAIFAGLNLVEFGSANFTVFELAPWSTTNYNDEVAYFTRDQALVNAFKTQFDRFWTDTAAFMDFADAYRRETGTEFPVQPAIDRARLEPDWPMPTSMVWGQGSDLRRRMVAEIGREQRAIDVVAFRLTDAEITRALIERHRAGVRVRVIVEPTEYLNRRYPEYEMTHARLDQLWAAGIPIRQRAHAGLTHMKTLITSRVALIASSNFTNNWQRDHNYFLPQSTKPTFHREMSSRFAAMWSATSSVDGNPPAFRRFRPGRPGAATLLGPSQGAREVSLTPTLTWKRAPWAVMYYVYVGTSPTSLKYVGRVAAAVRENPPATYSFSPSQPLPAGRTLYWRVVSRTYATRIDSRLVAGSSIWSFTTTSDTADATSTAATR